MRLKSDPSLDELKGGRRMTRSITYRRGTIEDSHTVFQIFVRTLMDYSERMNVMAITGGNDPQVLESLWKLRRPMFEYLANDAAQFWVAENDARSSLTRVRLSMMGCRN